MKFRVVIRVKPDSLNQEHIHKLADNLNVEPGRIKAATLYKRSIDSRHSNPVYELTYDVYLDTLPEPKEEFSLKLKNVKNAVPVVIVGAGPAGLFCALRLIELGIKPLILERGKNVKDRRKDVAIVSKKGVVNPNSNYCFGEGGAGTFSDGKLYTRSGKRGSIDRILNIFVKHGADPNILIDSHPHIGTNKLPAVISSISNSIIESGGEILYNTKVDQLSFDRNQIQVQGFEVKAMVAATGHSARDFLYLMDQAGVRLEQKPFALGVRVEHPQEFINHVQYGKTKYDLPSASYALRAQVNGRGVFSFCMCPGGIICPAATSNDEVVVNGWSPSKRNSYFANSGIVVEVKPEDYKNKNIFSGIELQKHIEQTAYKVGGGDLRAPAERLDNFVSNKLTNTLPVCSYHPGIVASDLREVFPKPIYDCLKEAFIEYNKKINGFVSENSLIVAPESRTSSPVRVPRDNISLMHVEKKGLFPCGEGAGYAGGIVSAAIDGERIAEAVERYINLNC